MLDFSFSELLLCFVVALVVLGPERMPGIARAIGRWTGQAKSYMRNLSAELERESQLAEIKKQVVDAQRILREESTSFEQSVRGEMGRIEHGAKVGTEPSVELPKPEARPELPSDKPPPAPGH